MGETCLFVVFRAEDPCHFDKDSDSSMVLISYGSSEPVADLLCKPCVSLSVYFDNSVKCGKIMIKKAKILHMSATCFELPSHVSNMDRTSILIRIRSIRFNLIWIQSKLQL